METETQKRTEVVLVESDEESEAPTNSDILAKKPRRELNGNDSDDSIKEVEESIPKRR